ncbi:MAG: hypothetical protein A3H49_05110 [Nitrospirae bacterium RIFCSPLOWO2_02_FULL_62_14]|nr:MAG: hypothetical protein A3H49_05110 [Nitrospirae bacterium RIFCSPLOWO2_02_FULL_62_14]
MAHRFGRLSCNRRRGCGRLFRGCRCRRLDGLRRARDHLRLRPNRLGRRLDDGGHRPNLPLNNFLYRLDDRLRFHRPAFGYRLGRGRPLHRRGRRLEDRDVPLEGLRLGG